MDVSHRVRRNGLMFERCWSLSRPIFLNSTERQENSGRLLTYYLGIMNASQKPELQQSQSRLRLVVLSRIRNLRDEFRSSRPRN